VPPTSPYSEFIQTLSASLRAPRCALILYFSHAKTSFRLVSNTPANYIYPVADTTAFAHLQNIAGAHHLGNSR
jgi:hypothetical protein